MIPMECGNSLRFTMVSFYHGGVFRMKWGMGSPQQKKIYQRPMSWNMAADQIELLSESCWDRESEANLNGGFHSMGIIWKLHWGLYSVFFLMVCVIRMSYVKQSICLIARGYSWQSNATPRIDGSNAYVRRKQTASGVIRLVGGLEHFLFSHILGRIIPID